MHLYTLIKLKPLNGQQKYFYWIYNTIRYMKISMIRESIL